MSSLEGALIREIGAQHPGNRSARAQHSSEPWEHSLSEAMSGIKLWSTSTSTRFCVTQLTFCLVSPCLRGFETRCKHPNRLRLSNLQYVSENM